LLSFVDDTVFIVKNVFNELLKDALLVSNNEFGRLCFLAILVGVNRKHFSQKMVDLLQPVSMPDPEDSTKQILTSKKDSESRRQEILSGIINPLAKFCSENIYNLAVNNYGQTVLQATIENCGDEKLRGTLLDCVLDWAYFDEEEINKEIREKKYHPMEEKDEQKVILLTHPNGHRLIKHLVLQNQGNFGISLLNKIETKLCSFLSDQFGSWVVLSLAESPSTKSRVVEAIKSKVEEMEDNGMQSLSHLKNACQTI